MNTIIEVTEQDFFITLANTGPQGASGEGTQYQEGEALESDPYVTLAGGRRMATPGLISGLADGDAISARFNGYGGLWSVLMAPDGTPISSFGGGTQYQEGATAATPTGNVLMWKGAGNEMLAVSADNPLPIDFAAEITIDNVTVSGTVAATQSGAWNVGITGAVPLPTGAATEQGLDDILAELSGGLTVDGTVTANAGSGTFASNMAQYGGVAVGATNGVYVRPGTGATFPVSGNVGITGTVPLPTGAATETTLASVLTELQGTLDVTGTVASNITQYGGTNIGAGNGFYVRPGTSAVFAASQSGSWNIGNITGTVSLPTGAATQTTLASVLTELQGTLDVSAVQSGSWNMGLSIGGVSGTIFDLTNSNPLATAIVDASGNQISSFGGGTQYNNGDASSDPTGTVGLWFDNVNSQVLATSTANPLPVEIISGGTGGGNMNLTEILGDPVSATNPLYVSPATGATFPISGSITNISGTISLPTGAATETTLASVLSALGGTLDVDPGTVAASQSGAWNIGNITGTVSLPTGAATQTTSAAILSALGSTLTVSGSGNFGANMAQYGGTNVGAGNAVHVQAGTSATFAATQSGGWSVGLNAGANVIGGVTQSGTWNIGSITTLPALPTGANTIGAVTQASGPWTQNITQMNSVAIAMSSGATSTGTQRVIYATDSPGIYAEDAAATSGDRGFSMLAVRNDALTAFGANGDYGWLSIDARNAVHTTAIASTAGGATPNKYISAASTNATVVKSSAGTLYLLTCSNTNANARYLKLYNKATSPTVGTDTPVFTFLIPGNTVGAGSNIPIPACGIAFSTGISFALTANAADSDNTAVTANENIVNIGTF